MNSNVSNVKKSASGAIKKILYHVMDEDILDFEDKVNRLTQRILDEGPDALESEKDYIKDFDDTYFKIFTHKAYKDYLKDCLSMANQSNNNVNYNQPQDMSFIQVNSVSVQQQIEEQKRPDALANFNGYIPIDSSSVYVARPNIVQQVPDVIPIRAFADNFNGEIPIDSTSVVFNPPRIFEEKKKFPAGFNADIPIDSTSVVYKPAPKQEINKVEHIDRQEHLRIVPENNEQYHKIFQNEMSIDALDQLKNSLRDQAAAQKEVEYVPVQRENKKEFAAREQIAEEDIPVNNAGLSDTFKKLKSQIEQFDENFTLTLDLSSQENYKKDALMLPIVQKHKESDFATLFNDFRPLLFDLLKRREGFEDFTQTLRNLAKKEKIASQNIIKSLEVKDILVLLAESCSEASLPQLGLWFSYQFYPLPLISLLGQKEYKTNLDCCLEYLFQVRKPLITSIGTKSALAKGKSSFLSYLFSIKNPTYFSTKNGFTHFGAVDLYVNLPSDQQNYIVADVQSYREDKEFMSLVSGVLSASQIILVHITKHDILGNGKVSLDFKLNKKNKVMYLWRDYDDNEDEDLLALAEKAIEKSEDELGIIGIPKLNNEQSFDVQNDKFEAMKSIFDKISMLNLQNCTPIVDLFKTFKMDEENLSLPVFVPQLFVV